MVGKWWLWLFGLSVAVVIGGASGGNVTYDGRSLIIDGQRKLLFSGSIHYPRSTPDMWAALISKAKDGGLDAIDTYVFWNLHETQPGEYDFSGRRDIVRFIKAVQAEGLYVCLRIGPFIESEWSYGGFPFWLHDIPGIVFRSDNEPFKFCMQNFTAKIVAMMKSEKLYASQGGPIILSQIENEYQMVEAAFHDKGPSYVRWAAAMAVGFQTGVPWAMCKQDDAPDPVINACNGMKCGETFVGPNSPNKPAIWTENWTHVYDLYGKARRLRSPEDIAYHTALFIARKNGSYVNYYMYHGGTNFGRTASSFALTSYYDQAPIDEYGLTRQPKFGHLKELHAAVKLSSHAILYGAKTNLSMGALQEAYVYSGDSGDCAAFLLNMDNRNNATVLFRNGTYRLPPKSISILPDCKTVTYNSAQVVTQFNTRSRQPAIKLDSGNAWNQWNEIVPSFNDTSVRSNMLLEQMNTTKDASDYLWYTGSYRLLNDLKVVLTVQSRGHLLHAFVNRLLVGSKHGSYANQSFILNITVPLHSGVNNISLLSIMVGLKDSGAYLERRVAGLRTVSIQANQAVERLSNYSWGYQVGLVGERLQLYSKGGSDCVKWNVFNSSAKPLTWYKTKFDAPGGKDPVALDLGSMGKGETWINGQSIGRYWISFRAPDGSPSQTWHHIPRSFLRTKDNELVMFEEETGNPLGISVDTVSTTKVCAHVFDSYPNRLKPQKGPNLRLTCPPPRNISKILFASYGTPLGDCQDYAVGRCHSSNSTSVVEKDCIGRRTCSIPQSSQKFGSDPCPGIPKSLLIKAQCQ